MQVMRTTLARAVVVTLLLLSAAASLVSCLPCHEIWFHNFSQCGGSAVMPLPNVSFPGANTSCAPFNGRCEYRCFAATSEQQCEEMQHCSVAGSPSNVTQATCRPRCEIITDPDLCWSTPSCWYYKSKCAPMCQFFSNGATGDQCRSVDGCMWYGGNFSTCLFNYSLARDPDACAQIASASGLDVSWSFVRRRCQMSCKSRTIFEADCTLDSDCQWYQVSPYDGFGGVCLDRCSVAGKDASLCRLLTGCVVLGGVCRRSCDAVNTFQTKPFEWNTTYCTALPYCQATTDNSSCMMRDCSRAVSKEECAGSSELRYMCIFIAGRCVSSCRANSTFANSPCPIGPIDEHHNDQLCEWKSIDGQFQCVPARCGNFTAFGRDTCLEAKGWGCMFIDGKCREKCHMFTTSTDCIVGSGGLCSFDSAHGSCYLEGCGREEQQDDLNLCQSGRVVNETANNNRCSWRNGKCYNTSCYSARSRDSCAALGDCVWINNSFTFEGCVDNRSALPAETDNPELNWQCPSIRALWLEVYNWNPIKCGCDISCRTRSVAGCNSNGNALQYRHSCSVDEFGLCAHSEYWQYNTTCDAPLAPPTTTTSPSHDNSRNTTNNGGGDDDGASAAVRIGVGIGVSMTILAVVAVAAFWYWRKRRTTSSPRQHMQYTDGSSLLGSVNQKQQNYRTATTQGSGAPRSASSASSSSSSSSSRGVAVPVPAVVLPPNARPIRPAAQQNKTSSSAASLRSTAEAASATHSRHAATSTVAEILDTATRQQQQQALSVSSQQQHRQQQSLLMSLRNNATMRSKLRQWDPILDGSARVADASFKEQSLNPSKFDTLQTLTHDECFAIALYTFENAEHGATRDDQFYYFLNNCHFRQRDPEVGAALAPFIAAFASAFAKLPPQHGAVYRGIAVASVEDQNKIRQQYSLGAQIRWHGLTSVSTDETVATNFELSGGGAGICFRIAAVDCRSVAAFSAVPSEDELLLAPGSAFVVVPPEKGFVQKNEKSHTIFLQQLGSQTVAY